MLEIAQALTKAGTIFVQCRAEVNSPLRSLREVDSLEFSGTNEMLFDELVQARISISLGGSKVHLPKLENAGIYGLDVNGTGPSSTVSVPLVRHLNGLSVHGFGIVDFPQLETINGDLRILATSIEDFGGLRALRVVSGRLVIGLNTRPA